MDDRIVHRSVLNMQISRDQFPQTQIHEKTIRMGEGREIGRGFGTYRYVPESGGEIEKIVIDTGRIECDALIAQNLSCLLQRESACGWCMNRYEQQNKQAQDRSSDPDDDPKFQTLPKLGRFSHAITGRFS